MASGASRQCLSQHISLHSGMVAVVVVCSIAAACLQHRGHLRCFANSIEAWIFCSFHLMFALCVSFIFMFWISFCVHHLLAIIMEVSLAYGARIWRARISAAVYHLICTLYRAFASAPRAMGAFHAWRASAPRAYCYLPPRMPPSLPALIARHCHCAET